MVLESWITGWAEEALKRDRSSGGSQAGMQLAGRPGQRPSGSFLWAPNCRSHGEDMGNHPCKVRLGTYLFRGVLEIPGRKEGM